MGCWGDNARRQPGTPLIPGPGEVGHVGMAALPATPHHSAVCSAARPGRGGVRGRGGPREEAGRAAGGPRSRPWSAPCPRPGWLRTAALEAERVGHGAPVPLPHGAHLPHVVGLPGPLGLARSLFLPHLALFVGRLGPPHAAHQPLLDPRRLSNCSTSWDWNFAPDPPQWTRAA